MMNFNADPRNPRGRRTGSLAGSGTHDEHTVIDSDGVHDVDTLDGVRDVAQAAGAGATELAAYIAARETTRN